MKFVLPTRDIKEVTYNNTLYQEVFLGGVLSTSLDDTVSTPEWDETKTDYVIKDEVYISDLETIYICGEDGNRDYPPSSSKWFPIAPNHKKMFDPSPSTQTIGAVGENIEVIFSVGESNYLVGQEIDNCTHLKVEALRDDDTVFAVLYDEEMQDILDFSCSTCCNPAPVPRRYFSLSYDSNCETWTKLKLTFTGYSDKNIRIGTLGIGRSYDMGCLLYGSSFGFEGTTEYVKAFQSIRLVKNETIVTMDGKVLMPTAQFDRNFKLLMQNAGYLNFYVIDETDKITSGNIIGTHKTCKFPFSTRKNEEVNFKIIGVFV